MQSNLREIVKLAFEASAEDFIKITDDAVDLLSSEKGKAGKYDMKGRLVNLNPEGTAIVAGDLHGDLESLVEILTRSECLDRMRKRHDHYLIFLGDYGDRGVHSAETYYVVLSVKLLFPEQTILLRGNHEVSEPGLIAVPHNLPFQLRSRFGQGNSVYEKLKRLFPVLYNATYVHDRCLMIHGGLTPAMKTLDDIADAKIGGPHEALLENMLWSDPDDSIRGVAPSPRGAGNLFGEDVTQQVLRDLGVELLIRGHEPAEEGFRINHSGKVLTLFSRKGPPYFNPFGAYLDLNLAATVERAEQLMPCIHRF